jgi:hypothetical protein
MEEFAGVATSEDGDITAKRTGRVGSFERESSHAVTKRAMVREVPRPSSVKVITICASQSDVRVLRGFRDPLLQHPLQAALVLVAAALPRIAWFIEGDMNVGSQREAPVAGHLLARASIAPLVAARFSIPISLW